MIMQPCKIQFHMGGFDHEIVKRHSDNLRIPGIYGWIVCRRHGFVKSRRYVGPYCQPPQKAYLDFNDGWPVNSWEITEPAIYYQASYIKLLSKFVGQAEDNSGSGGAIESHLKIGNFPNPFRDETTIHYMLASDSRVTVAVFNAFGEKVITLFEGFQQKGAHSVLWNPNTESSGVYVCRATIRAGGKQVERVKKMVLCR